MNLMNVDWPSGEIEFVLDVNLLLYTGTGDVGIAHRSVSVKIEGINPKAFMLGAVLDKVLVNGVEMTRTPITLVTPMHATPSRWDRFKAWCRRQWNNFSWKDFFDAG